MTGAPLLGSADGGIVRLTRVLPATTPVVWEALSDGRRLPAWLGRLVGRLDGVGSRVELWHEEAVRSCHTVLRWVPRRVLGLTWEFPDEPDSAVTFELEPGDPDDDRTWLRLTHEGLTDPPGYAAGWHRHLDFLDAHLTGTDLRFEDFWTGYDDLVARYGR